MSLRSAYRDILRDFIPIESPEGTDFVLRKRDPSLLFQLRERALLPESTRLQSYLDAVSKAPHASSGTKRRWRRVLGL